MNLLNGKTALVTGGATGIGFGIAQRLLDEGASVVIADINEEQGRQAQAKLQQAGGNAWFISADLSDVASIDRLMAAAVAQLGGKLDILVNNAGVTKRIALLELTPAEWDWVQGVNSRGLFFCMQRAALHMKDHHGGSIVNIASIAGKGTKGTSNAAYGASKAAAIVLARIAAAELGSYGIRVNSVCPGPVRTAMWDGLEKATPAIAADIVQRAVLGRISEPRDIGDAVVFLASDMASNITGQSINVDGGTMWD